MKEKAIELFVYVTITFLLNKTGKETRFWRKLVLNETHKGKIRNVLVFWVCCLLVVWNKLLSELQILYLKIGMGFPDGSVQFSHSVVSDCLWPHGLEQARLPCPSPTPRVYSNSCPLSWWRHATISSSVIPFSSCLQSFPASESFLF